MQTVLAFMLTLGVLIAFHEYGHFRVARACGVKVLRFAIGFGPVIFRRQATPDATEYVVCLLPLGGYVRMLDSREDSVTPAMRGQAFDAQPLSRRALIVAAGPAANFLLALVLYASVSWMGVQEPKAVLGAPIPGSLAERAGQQSGDWITAVRTGDEWREIQSINELRWAVTQSAVQREDLILGVEAAGRSTLRSLSLPLSTLAAADVDATLFKRIGLGGAFSAPVLGALTPGGPAAGAGLMTGDRVLRVNDQAVTDAASLRETIRASVTGDAATRMSWLIERGPQRMTIDVLPRIVTDGGRAVARVDAQVGAAPEWVTVQRGFLGGLEQGARRTWEVSAMTLTMLGRMLIGEASVRNLSGPITIADYAGQSVGMGLSAYLGFLALVSVSLGVLNLLPLPMLDGGHLMYYLFEGLTGRPVSESWLRWLQRGGVLLLVMLMTLALSNDVARLFGLQ